VQDTLEELDIRLEVQDTLEVQVTLDTPPEVQDTLEELDIRLEVQDTLALLDTHQEVMAIPQEDILQEERQDTLLEDLTQDIQQEAMDTPQEAMVTPPVDTLQEEQQATLLEVMDTQLEDMDTLLEVMDIQLEGMDTLQAAIQQDILLEGIQGLQEVDTTEKNKTPLMVRRLVNDINST